LGSGGGEELPATGTMRGHRRTSIGERREVRGAVERREARGATWCGSEERGTRHGGEKTGMWCGLGRDQGGVRFGHIYT
jgi:hypothetical protein